MRSKQRLDRYNYEFSIRLTSLDLRSYWIWALLPVFARPDLLGIPRRGLVWSLTNLKGLLTRRVTKNRSQTSGRANM